MRLVEASPVPLLKTSQRGAMFSMADNPYFSGQSQAAYNWLMRDVQEVLSRLSRSPFRSRIHLEEKELDYLRTKGMREVLKHAAEFIKKRLAPASPVNDGKQTPWRNHPVFVAQHATATCCRGCLQKWHQIPKGRELTTQEQQYIVNVIGTWLSGQEEVIAEQNAKGGTQANE